MDKRMDKNIYKQWQYYSIYDFITIYESGKIKKLIQKI